MRKSFVVLFLFVSFHCKAGIEDHYKKLDNKRPCLAPRNIDYIYLINLDQRPERWIRCAKELAPFGIFPQRFSAIYGWTLQPELLNDIGLRFQEGMWAREWIMHFPDDAQGKWEFLPLTTDFYGKVCFSGWTVKGTIGCSLSHLSVLKDAYDSGYQTIWILEDDIVVLEDPHSLSDLIEELDALVGEWDLLYTDFECMTVDKKKDLGTQLPMMWRPDMPYLDISYLVEHFDVGDKFMKIGGRSRAHSILYRRSGIAKILDFYRTHHNFLPYDQEIPLIPGLQLYVLKQNVVSFQQTTSDTRYRNFQ